MYFPGRNSSGSGFWVLHKGTDSVGPPFCALPRSEQLRRPGAWRVHIPQVGRCALSPPWSQPLSFLGGSGCARLQCALCLFWGADLWLRPSWQKSTIQNPKGFWLVTGCLLARGCLSGAEFASFQLWLSPSCFPVSSGGWAGLQPAREFGEVSGHRVLIKRGPGNRGPTECGTTHEATSGMSS